MSRTGRCVKAAPLAMPQPTEVRDGCLASWAPPEHASLMASSTMDDHLAVHNDAAVCAGAKLREGTMSLEVMDTDQSWRSVTCAECRDCYPTPRWRVTSDGKMLTARVANFSWSPAKALSYIIGAVGL